MCDLVQGKYLIVPARIAAPSPYPVGANIKGDDPVTPVVSGGKINTWSIHKLEGDNYSLVLDEDGRPRWLSKAVGDTVVVDNMPAPSAWVIRKKDDGYLIEVPYGIRPTRGWTLESTVPGTKVKLEIIGEHPRPDQLWMLIPLPE